MPKLDLVFLRKLRLFFLALGSGIAWYSVITSFSTFYKIEGTLFKIKDCAIPNPVTTPCFWGALGFLVTLLWAYKLQQQSAHAKALTYFLAVCVVFAWTNFGVELMGVDPIPGAIISPCPAGGKSPFVSACFFGSILFTLSFVTTLALHKLAHSSNTNT